MEILRNPSGCAVPYRKVRFEVDKEILMVTLLMAAVLALAQDPERIQKLIQDLSDASKDERTKAVDELAKIGRPALDALRKAAGSSDLEVKGLAAQAIERIEWVGLDRLKKYAKDNLDEGSSVELSKIKNLARWFPDVRFYEVAAAPPAGNQQAAMMVNMGMGMPKSLFAVRKYEDAFHRLSVKGIFSPASISAFVQKAKISLPDDDAALDFAVAYMEIQAAGTPQNASNWMMTGASRLERTADGWSLQAGMYGGHVVFKTDKDGTLVAIDPKGGTFSQGGIPAGDKASEERARLEIEKLRLEIEILKRQAEKK
jgi:hypothetical protein